MSSARQLARPEIASLRPYASARRAVSDAGGTVRLDANECPWPAFPNQTGLNRYPSPQPAELRQRLASLYEVSPENVLVTRGSDEAIDLLMRVFCRPHRDAVVVCPPTFGYYRVAAEIQGAGVRAVRSFDEIASVAAEPDNAVKLVFVCSPNNPTGETVAPARIVDLCRRLEDQIVVVDEAYVELSSTESLASAVDDVANLVVTRTLSKAFGLAGARVGAAVASPDVIELMAKVQAPYPIPLPSVRAALDALTPHGVAVMHERVTRLREEREKLSRELENSPDVRRVLPSDANFLLVELTDTAAIARKLNARGILVRRFDGELDGHVRVSVGTPEENALLLDALGNTECQPHDERSGIVVRTTNETRISASVELDRADVIDVETGVGFFDHMLEQVARHAGIGLRLECAGDLDVDDHHTVEDCALVLGEALRRALGDKRGIERYGFVLPMDEARCEVLVDLSGRPVSVFDGAFPDRRVGGLSTELVPHVFESLAQSLGAAIHVRVSGANTHHMVEACFKGLGRALRQAFRRSGDAIPSTKGVL